MVFSDASAYQGLIQALEFNTMSGISGISGNADYLKQATRLANNGLNAAVGVILRSTKSWQWDDLNQTNLPKLLSDLVAGQQDYSWPTPILQIYKVEIDYTGNGRYVVAEEVDSESDDIASDEDSESTQYSQDAPKYNVFANSIFLLPRPTANVTDGIRIWITREVSKFASTDTTKKPGIDDIFHEYIATHMTYNWEKVYHPDRAGAWKLDLDEMGVRLGDYYANKTPNKVHSITTNKINWR